MITQIVIHPQDILRSDVITREITTMDNHLGGATPPHPALAFPMQPSQASPLRFHPHQISALKYKQTIIH